MVAKYDIVIEEGVESPISVEELKRCNLVLSEGAWSAPCTVSPFLLLAMQEIRQVNLSGEEKMHPLTLFHLR